MSSGRGEDRIEGMTIPSLRLVLHNGAKLVLPANARLTIELGDGDEYSIDGNEQREHSFEAAPGVDGGPGGKVTLFFSQDEPIIDLGPTFQASGEHSIVRDDHDCEGTAITFRAGAGGRNVMVSFGAESGAAD